MRNDMGKVIIERPRYGMRIKQPKGSKKNTPKIDLEDQPKNEKIRRKWISNWNDSKRSTDVLGPLAGYVRKQIGRPFSKVFSEISKVLRPTGLTGSHAQDHLWRMLITKVVIDEQGRPCHSDMPRFKDKKENIYLPIISTKYSDIAYVDPRDGIIKASPKERTFKKKLEIPYVIWEEKNEDGAIGYKQIKGIWYEITFEKVRKQKKTEVKTMTYSKMKFYRDVETITNPSDCLLKTTSIVFGLKDSDLYSLYGTNKYVGISKRQLNKKEIKKFGLKDKKTVTFSIEP